MLGVDNDLTLSESSPRDAKQFELLYNNMYSSLQKYAIYYVHDKEVAKSVVNDLFVQLWFKPYDPANIRGYLYRSVKNSCFNYLKKHQKNPLFYLEQNDVTALADLNPTVENNFAETHQLEFLQRAIALLPQKRQLVFKMHRLEGFSYAEIADLLQISPRTVEDHLSKAMQFIHAQAKQFLYANLTEA